jgi:crotonobetainyl-CoA:carnitine CoA-transferase CaiB-like acyl-CoA transferase
MLASYHAGFNRESLTRFVQQSPTENWMARLGAQDVPCAPVLTRGAVYGHPQVAANGSVIERDHPQAGRIRQARPPARFSTATQENGRPAPSLGADTRAVLAEAGYDRETIDGMIADGVATDAQDMPE